jgi:hypothetical protein
MSDKTTRKYVRLEPSTWASIRAEWECGDTTLAELSERYNVAQRTLQAHFAQHGTTKGSEAQALAVTVRERVFEQQLSDPDLLASRARDIRESAFRDAQNIEDILAAQLEAARLDPSSAIKAVGLIKALSLAAATLERTHDLKMRALGLDRPGAIATELPELRLRDISQQEIVAIQSGEAFEDDELADELPTVCV